jgi:hypothetical protein
MSRTTQLKPEQSESVIVILSVPVILAQVCPNDWVIPQLLGSSGTGKAAVCVEFGQLSQRSLDRKSREATERSIQNITNDQKN